MYEEYVINSNANTSNCNCKKNKDNSSFQKINLQGSCAPNVFAVSNYFSELVHDWEKEAARNNLGISELENITYETDQNNGLITVTFVYRKGMETFIRSFPVSGQPGKDGKDGKDGAQGPQGPAPTLNNVNIQYFSDDTVQPHGDFVLTDNGYTLNLYLKTPTINVNDLQTITNLVKSQLTYYDIDQVRIMIGNLERRITDLEERIQYLTSEQEANTPQLTYNGNE